MLKSLEPKFCPDLSARLKDKVEKQVPGKLNPTVNTFLWWRVNVMALLYR